MTPPSLRFRLRECFNTSISKDVLLEAAMLIFVFATGIEDSTTFPAYRCFVSNQTGNTILLAAAITGIGPNFIQLPNIAASLSMFYLGGFTMGQLRNFLGSYWRDWLLVSSLFQVLLVFAGAWLQYQKEKDALDKIIPVDLIVIGLLAISSSSQLSIARALQMTEITTANSTGVYVDLFINRNLYRLRNRPWNRRLLFLISLLAGSFAGAYAYPRFNSKITLSISAIGKTGATAALFFIKGTVEGEDSSNKSQGQSEARSGCIRALPRLLD